MAHYGQILQRQQKAVMNWFIVAARKGVLQGANGSGQLLSVFPSAFILGIVNLIFMP